MLLLLSSCQSTSNEAFESAATPLSADTTAGKIISSAAARTGADSNRKFVRTAQLKFRVRSVIGATYAIEDAVVRQGGFVTSTQLQSAIQSQTTVPVSPDSLLETTTFAVSNTLTLRVPDTRLNTTLKAIAQNVDYLDYRILNAEEIGLQLLQNELSQKRASQSSARLSGAMSAKGKKLNETLLAGEAAVAAQQETADNAMLSNLSLTDQVQYSTVYIEMYQRATTQRQLLPNETALTIYEPSFGRKVAEALRTGWQVLEALLLFAVQIWGLLLLAGIALFAWRKWRRRQG